MEENTLVLELSNGSEVKLPDGTTHLVFKLKDENNKPIQNNIAVAKQFYGCFNRALIKATNNNIGWPANKVHQQRIKDC